MGFVPLSRGERWMHVLYVKQAETHEMHCTHISIRQKAVEHWKRLVSFPKKGSMHWFTLGTWAVLLLQGRLQRALNFGEPCMSIWAISAGLLHEAMFSMLSNGDSHAGKTSSELSFSARSAKLAGFFWTKPGTAKLTRRDEQRTPAWWPKGDQIPAKKPWSWSFERH